MDVKNLSDSELWLLTCAMEELHDSMRHNSEEYKEGVVDLAGDIREKLEVESKFRRINYTRWQN